MEMGRCHKIVSRRFGKSNYSLEMNLPFSRGGGDELSSGKDFVQGEEQV